MKYWVIERYYDNGKTTAEILEEQNGYEQGYTDGYMHESEIYDLYATLCNSHKEALEYAKQVREA